MSEKITASHLEKIAFVYVRQSSPQQVQQHTESREVQYNLAQRAKQLGWRDEMIVIIDEDLGLSAMGSKQRGGFETILEKIPTAGAIFFLYASRFARNSREWHKALELCHLFNVLIIDRESVYAPRLAGDLLSLSMQGSFSEYEVRQMQIRAREAIQNKASRGQMFTLLPPGFVLTEDSRVELAPDLRVQEAIRLVFSLFDELRSVRQVSLWFQEKQLTLPVRDRHRSWEIRWDVPDYATVYRILTNPLYAGIYMYPKTRTVTTVAGGKIIKKAGHRTNDEDERILIEDLFISYISKEQFYRNQQIIRDNAFTKDTASRGAVREGRGLLTGLLNCKVCGRRMTVRYRSGVDYATYYCPGARNEVSGCVRFNGRALERLVSEALIATLQPQAIAAAIQASEKYNRDLARRSQAIAQALEQARYQAGLCEKRFNQEDPDNRLVTKVLSARWQQALEKVADLEDKCHELSRQHQELSEKQRQELLALASDLKNVWHRQETNYRAKKHILRLLIEDIWVEADADAEGFLKAYVHWKGGVHTSYRFKRRAYSKSKKEQCRFSGFEPSVIRELAKVADDQQISRILNRGNYPLPSADEKCNWTTARVMRCRQQYKVPAFTETAYRKLQVVTLKEAAKSLGISMASVLELIGKNIIEAKQVIKHAPWQIPKSELERPAVLQVVRALQKRATIVCDENQESLRFEGQTQ